MRRGDGLILLVLCLAGGLRSWQMGTDINWDLMNYQFYGPYALLTGRGFQDLAAGQLQSFFNPIAHVPQYVLMRALNDWPRLFAFLMGLPAGVYAFVLGKTCLVVLRAAFPAQAGLAWLAAPAWLIGITGADFLSLIGLSSNDVNLGLLVLLALWLALREAASPSPLTARGLGWLALAGAVMGLALGLKLTNIIYAAPFGIMVLALFGLRAAVLTGISMVAGFLLTWGGWAWFLWRNTGNPVFPMYNDIFRSPDFPPIRIADERFLPRDLWQGLFYPFFWLRKASGMVTELPMRDPRLALAMLGVAGLAIAALRNWPWSFAAARRQRATLFLLGFAIMGYAMWAKTFGIYRYLLVLETLSGLLVVLALGLLLRARVLAGFGAACAIALGAILWVAPPNWGHARYGAQVLWVDPLPVQPTEMVVTLDDAPHGYLVPFMPPEVRVMGAFTNLTQPHFDSGLRRRIIAAVAAHPGGFRILTTPHLPLEETNRRLEPLGLIISGECQIVRTTMDTHRFCRATRR
ncbi:hypothetical protein [Rhodovarius lipocyclicus]|uniref:hypothetical protein n=1 Tax=Rhodovarius lipocyclicus TaxID=268410 RepID=UPI00135B1654|nr:hypothetical protein [Rhodovarius lipocyclicus]